MPKMDMEVSAETDALIDEIAQEAGCSRKEVIRRGLSVMKAFSLKRKEGQTHIGFVADSASLDTEVVGVL